MNRRHHFTAFILRFWRQRQFLLWRSQLINLILPFHQGVCHYVHFRAGYTEAWSSHFQPLPPSGPYPHLCMWQTDYLFQSSFGLCHLNVDGNGLAWNICETTLPFVCLSIHTWNCVFIHSHMDPCYSMCGGSESNLRNHPSFIPYLSYNFLVLFTVYARIGGS